MIKVVHFFSITTKRKQPIVNKLLAFYFI